MEVNEVVENVPIQGNPELYLKMNLRMKWNEVTQTQDSYRPVPVWSGEVPFVSKVHSPIEYYRRFIDEEILQHICNESNRFALQADINNTLCLSPDELEKFIGVSFYMSLVKLPRTRYYWSSDLEIPAVTNYMSMRRWETIKTYLHFANNDNMPDKGTPGYDRIYKIRPFLDLLNSRFNDIPMSEQLSVDEQMIPYSGTRGPRYYVKGKPNPWGFKAWVLADSMGIVYNYDLCIGTTPRQVGHPNIGSIGNTVLKLASLIPDNQNFKLTMDNYFSTLPLFYELLNRGIHCMGTVRLDRVSGIKDIIASDAEIKSLGRSAFIEYEGKLGVKGKKDIRVLRWHDNNFVNLMSTYSSAYPTDTVTHWDRNKETNAAKVTVTCPSTVKVYNCNMGGIDTMDSLLGFYRIFFRSKKWYHRLFFHFVDMALINAWLLYRRDFNSYSESSGKPMRLYEFKANVSLVLRKQCKPIKRPVGCPSNSASNTNLSVPSDRMQHNTKIPQKDVIDDPEGHFVVALDKRGMCAVKGCYSRPIFYCIKCQVYLCLSAKKNCFAKFHGFDLESANIPH
ncbi:unnamed protein product, partial [Meganyctiphanes norvegica]